ncbi:ABC transporter permease [Pseudoclavibacter endophyticus]|uniref:ABC transporter permease subunit n=1 Tax=Pseudoclavibacter endophyticus TaxID=1778590 RepID=A0A6H9WSE8_9MICO|nr:ABC transporter permease subunit [Pseudoclavibacter endophyticus]KAB1649264.1 ABC transporter permease subunit [Pseudoclavibacter endophyticus]GGA64010.1 ABC transporter permease [Pseudoclavibacter endophyticus]
MSILLDALAWLVDPANWSGASGIPARVGEHLLIVLATIALAGAVAWPLGAFVGHARRGAAAVAAVTGAARAIPTLGLLTLFGLWLGIGLGAPLIALVVLAIPSLLAGTYAGMHAIAPDIPAAASAIGMTPLQVVARVELPLALPVIIGGLRAATLQVVATATLAAYISDLGVGRYIFAGLKLADYGRMLGGAIVVIVIALALELILALAQRLAVTRVANPAAAFRRHDRIGAIADRPAIERTLT